MHIHGGHGEAKFWLKPNIELVKNYGLTAKELQVTQRLIEEHEDEIKNAWQQHFST